MRKVLIATALLFVAVLTGCSQEKAKITTYMQALEASNAQMKGIAKDMEASMSGLQDEIQGGKFDAEAVKTKIVGFSDKMKAEKSNLEGMEVPEKAKVLHDLVVNQYQTAIEVLAETGPMIDMAKIMTDATKMVKDDPSKGKEVMAKMQATGAEIQAVQTKVGELAKKGQEFEMKAREEQKRLAEEFGIEIKNEEGVPAAK